MDSLKRVCVLALMSAFVSAICFASSVDEEDRRYQAVVAYWEWSNYWDPNGVDFPGVRFRTGLSFAAVVFFSSSPSEVEPYWGFCSRSVSVCQAYWALKDGSITRAASTVMRVSETNEQALTRFREQGFDEAIRPPNQKGLVLVPPSQDTKRTTHPRASDTLRVLRKKVTLKKLGIPEATRLRRRNRFVEEWVKSLGPPDKCRATVPFADERSFVVPVLTECPQEKSIMFMRRVVDEWVATPGGCLRLQGPEVEPVEVRIRTHASLVINPK